MSDTGSVANFAVDSSGREVPIRYKASDLVNRPAPEGYVWERRFGFEEAQREAWDGPEGVFHGADWPGDPRQYDYYIAVKKESK
jgi:hypothetical protein